MTADRDDLAAIGRQIITDYALDHESLHANWRCEHPDVYAPCGCVDEFLTSFASMVLESDWLADRLAKAWVEGRRAEYQYQQDDGGFEQPPNPYRADRVDAEDGGR